VSTVVYDVAVVGAGVHGASAAYHLTRAGHSVIVVERGYPASGPTGRSSAICRAYYTNPFLAAVAGEAIAWMADFPASLGGESGFHNTGALYIHPPADTAEVETVAAALNATGVRVDVLDHSELARRVPGINLDTVGVGVWEHGAGYADPVLTTTAMLDAARRLGATVRIRTGVSGIETDGAQVRLTTEAEPITASRVLLAMGPWTRPMVATLGLDLPLRVERHVVGSYAGGDVTPSFVLADLAAGFYGKPEHGGQYLLGWLHPAADVDPSSFAERISDSESLELVAAAVTRLPFLETMAPRGGWAGLYDVSPDWQPVIGEIAPRVFVHAGSSGHGFKLAPVLGRYVADLVAGERVAELEQFSPQRFAAGERVPAGFGEIRIIG
jgi:glycine/D-amino acid oxidase-like deaminating enzyme